MSVQEPRHGTLGWYNRQGPIQRDRIDEAADRALRACQTSAELAAASGLKVRRCRQLKNGEVAFTLGDMRGLARILSTSIEAILAGTWRAAA